MLGNGISKFNAYTKISLHTVPCININDDLSIMMNSLYIKYFTVSGNEGILRTTWDKILEILVKIKKFFKDIARSITNTFDNRILNIIKRMKKIRRLVENSKNMEHKKYEEVRVRYNSSSILDRRVITERAFNEISMDTIKQLETVISTVTSINRYAISKFEENEQSIKDFKSVLNVFNSISEKLNNDSNYVQMSYMDINHAFTYFENMTENISKHLSKIDELHKKLITLVGTTVDNLEKTISKKKQEHAEISNDISGILQFLKNFKSILTPVYALISRCEYIATIYSNFNSKIVNSSEPSQDTQK